MAIDYHNLRHEDSAGTYDGKQLEKYYNKSRDSYDVLLREDRFGEVLGTSENLKERDADQLLEAGKTDVDMEGILNGD